MVLGILSGLTFLASGACTDGKEPTALELGHVASFMLAPRYALTAVTESESINRLRITVVNAANDSVLMVQIEDVDPSLDQWDVKIEVPLGEEGETLEVYLILELIHVSSGGTETVEWAGATEPIVAEAGETGQVQEVEIYRGPVENLSVTDVTMADPSSTSIMETDTLQFSATFTGGGEGALVYWGSLSPTVASINSSGLLLGLLPGTTQIVAVAGPHADTVSITITQIMSAVAIVPDSILLPSIGDTAVFTATVVDPRGDEVPGTEISWELGDSEIVSDLGDGRYLAVDNGSTTIVVTGWRSVSEGATAAAATPGIEPETVTATASLTVRQAVGQVLMDPDSARFTAVGDTEQFTAVPADARGTVVEGVDIVWGWTDDLVVAVSDDGLATAVGYGTASVTATANEVVGAAPVTVDQIAFAIEVSPEVDTLFALGDTLRLVATSWDANEHVVTGKAYGWSSSDDLVATVNSTGLVTAMANGDVEITVSMDDVSATASLTVRFLPTLIQVTPAQETLDALGDTVRFTAVLLDAQGNPIPDRVITWSTSDEAIATVNSSGLAISVGNGTATITAASDTASGTAALHIAQVVDVVEVDPAVDTLAIGEEGAFVGMPMDRNRHVVESAALTWESSNPTLAPITVVDLHTIHVTPTDTGSVTITATSENDLEGSATVLLVSGEMASIDIRPGPVEIRSGETIQLEGIPLDENGIITPIPDSVSAPVWSSDDGEIAAVDAATGLVSGLATGMTYVRVTAEPFTDSVEVTVTLGIAVTATFLNPSADTTATAGDVITVLLAGTDAYGNRFNTGFTLGSSDNSVLVLIGDSAFVGELTGTATLTATVDTMSVSIDVTVMPGATVDVVFLNPSQDTTMTSGDAAQLHAMVYDVYGNEKETLPTYVGLDPESGIIRVSADTAYAELVGATDVVASADEIADTVAITVVHGAATAIAFTTPEADAVNLGAGDNLQTAAQATDLFSNPFTEGITFRSSAASIAAVDPSGLLIGVALGDAWIYAEINPADSFLVHVIPGALSTVTITPEADTALAVGDTLVYVADPRDGLGNPVDTVAFEWSLSDPAIGTLTTNGATAKVVAVGNGVASLIVDASKGGLHRYDTASVYVQVVVDQVIILPDTATLTLFGATVDLSGRVTAEDANDNVIAGVAFTWSSLDDLIASVDASGVVTATGDGSVGIVATAEGKADTATVTVSRSADLVQVTPVHDTVDVGSGVGFTAAAWDSNGDPIPSPSVTWSSTAGGVASVDASGTATGVSEGKAGIVATVDAAADTAVLAVLDTNTILSTAFAGGAFAAQAQPGDTIAVPVTFDMTRASPTGDLGSVQFDLNYDSNTLQYESVTKGIVGSPIMNGDLPGSFKFAYADLSPQGTGDLTLATVYFTVKAGATVGSNSLLDVDFTATPTSTAFEYYYNLVAIDGRLEIISP